MLIIHYTCVDMTMVVRKADGSVHAHHADGTVIVTSGQRVTVRAHGFATIELEPQRKASYTACVGGVHLSTLDRNVGLATPDGSSVRVKGANVICEPGRMHPLGVGGREEFPAALPGSLLVDLNKGVLRLDDADGNLFVASASNAIRAVPAAVRERIAAAAAAFDGDEMEAILSGEADEETEEFETEEVGVAEPEQEEDETEGETTTAKAKTQQDNSPFATYLASGKHESHPPRLFLVREDGSAVQFLQQDGILLRFLSFKCLTFSMM